MKFSYKFSNLLGSVYKKGDLVFTPDGNSVISCVGNRISIFDVRNNKTSTLPVESRFNYETIDLNPNGCILLAVNEEGEAHMISLVSQTIVHKFRFKRKVNAVKFSPNGEYFAVCRESEALIYRAPSVFTGLYNSFTQERVVPVNEGTCLDWSFDSRVLAVGTKDMKVLLYPLDRWKNFKLFTLGSHADSIVGCFFEDNSYDITTIDRNGHTCVWECTVEPEQLIPRSAVVPVNKRQRKSSDSEDEVDVSKSLEQTPDQLASAIKKVSVEDSQEDKDKHNNEFYYKRIAKHYLADEPRKSDRAVTLTSAAYHRKTKIFITGFSNGSFFIYESPDMSLIHSLNISDQVVSAIAFNCTGDWIALGCGGLGQLLVWEWQSETHVLKQQGHTTNMSCVHYSPDGQTLATGGDDGKVKLWNLASGYCFVTFTEHSAAVTALTFSPSKRALLSASLDGTVRAFDMLRYRNFRTFTSPSPKPVQFSSVSVDGSGELVAAGARDVFEIHLWSIKTGRLLEVLSGHEAPVSAVTFSPTLTSSTLLSISWDGTLRVWEALSRGSAHETIQLLGDGLAVVWRPDGTQAAVATLDGRISVFEVATARQVASIEGRADLGSGRADTDLVTAKKTLEGKSFTSLCYSADGEYLLAGGQSKNVCIYYIKEALILKKFEITQNRSFDAVDDFINRRKMSEMVGNKALIEEREETEGGNVKIKLPGVRRGDMASRILKPEVQVFCLQFSPTGQQWAAVTTEGLLVYSLNPGLVFDPWDLEIDVTPAAIKEALEESEYTTALVKAIKLNEAALIQSVIEKIPPQDVELIVRNLSERYVERLLVILASCLESSRHVEYYSLWIGHTLRYHGPRLAGPVVGQRNSPSLMALEKSLVGKYEQLAKLCDFNKYTINFIENLGTSIKTEAFNDEMEDDEHFVLV